MGLGRRACKPVKVILDIDPSVLGGNYRAYAEGLYSDESRLEIDPLEAPTRFTLRPLTDAQKDAVDSMEGRERAKLAIRCALIAMDNYTVMNADGSEERVTAPPMEHAGRLGECIPDSWIEKTNFPGQQLAALYVAIVNISEAQLPLSKPSAPEYGPQNGGKPESTGQSLPGQDAASPAPPSNAGDAAAHSAGASPG